MHSVGKEKYFPSASWLWVAWKLLIRTVCCLGVMTHFPSLLIMGFLIGIWKTTPKSRGLDDCHVLSPRLCPQFFRKTFSTWPSGRTLSHLLSFLAPPQGPSSQAPFPTCSLYGRVTCWSPWPCAELCSWSCDCPEAVLGCLGRCLTRQTVVWE